MAPPVEPRLLDTLGRPLRNLRVSVTDRCNLRCQYCMPEEEYTWLQRSELLTFEEIQRLVDVFTDLGSTRSGSPAGSRSCAGIYRTWCGYCQRCRPSGTWR
jgi:2-iminoacetate synthase ThiH